jgi:lysophospholipase L1-like esterase
MRNNVYISHVPCLMAVVFLAMFMVVSDIEAATYNHDVKAAEEFRVRDGLPNFLEKVKAGGTVRIAYLGGSITAASGWRPKTLAWFKTQYPQAAISEINAAISGTGSDYGACRIKGDVLAQDPNIVFLECRVNGGGGFELKSVEGIVRQIWKHNPRIDICFVYTVGHWMLKDLQAGKNVWFGDILEKVANAYGIPSIDLGVEVAAREKAGTLVFKGDTPVPDKMAFSKDGVHPGDAGHDLYCEIIARSMVKMADTGTAQAHVLPTPLETTNWETASLLPVTNAVLSAGWTPVNTTTDAVYIDDRGRTDGMLRGAVKCNRAGASITVKWNGTTVGISDIPYGEPCIVEAVVDGGAPIIAKRVQTEKQHKYARFWYLPGQPAGEHTVTFTVKDIPAGSWFYVGQLLIVGTPMP